MASPILTANLTDPSAASLLDRPDDTTGKIKEIFHNTLRANTFTAQRLVLDRHILFQIVQILDISTSKLSQIEELQYQAGPESSGADRVRNRVIRSVPLDDDSSTNVDGSSDASGNASSGSGSSAKRMYRLLLQDSRGKLIYGIELIRLPFLSSETKLGSKIIVQKGTLIQRGVFLLTPHTVDFLGGEIAEWNANPNLMLEFLQQELKGMS